MCFYKILLFKPKFLSLIRDLGNWTLDTQTRIFCKSEHSSTSVVPALQLYYVTVCVPGPCLNISHCHSLQGSLREGEGTIINRSLLHQPIPSALSLSSLPLTLYLCRALPLNSQHTASSSFFFFTPPSSSCPQPVGFQCLSLALLSLLPPSSVLPVRLVMGLKDVCDEAHCCSVSGMPLPPSVPTEPPPASTHSVLQSARRQGCNFSRPLCLSSCNERCLFNLPLLPRRRLSDTQHPLNLANFNLYILAKKKKKYLYSFIVFIVVKIGILEPS